MKTVKYEEAMQRLQQIAHLLESGELNIDDMTNQLKEAQKLIKMCRDKLTKTDADIKALIDGEAL